MSALEAHEQAPDRLLQLVPPREPKHAGPCDVLIADVDIGAMWGANPDAARALLDVVHRLAAVVDDGESVRRNAESEVAVPTSPAPHADDRSGVTS